MSGWQGIIQSKLLNCVDKHGHNYTNCLESAVIIGEDGGLWGRSEGMLIGKRAEEVEGKGIVAVDEFKNIVSGFKNKGDCKIIGGYWINGEKYVSIGYDEGTKVLKLKKNGGGAIVAKIKTAYLIGTWADKNKMQKDGKDLQQNMPDATTAVEELQEELIKNGY